MRAEKARAIGVGMVDAGAGANNTGGERETFI